MSAQCYPDHVRHYLQTETHGQAMLGPFNDLPFTWAQVCPLMTRPKRTPATLRIIVDLSYPHWPVSIILLQGIYTVASH